MLFQTLHRFLNIKLSLTKISVFRRQRISEMAMKAITFAPLKNN